MLACGLGSIMLQFLIVWLALALKFLITIRVKKNVQKVYERYNMVLGKQTRAENVQPTGLECAEAFQPSVLPPLPAVQAAVSTAETQSHANTVSDFKPANQLEADTSGGVVWRVHKLTWPGLTEDSREPTQTSTRRLRSLVHAVTAVTGE